MPGGQDLSWPGTCSETGLVVPDGDSGVTCATKPASSLREGLEKSSDTTDTFSNLKKKSVWACGEDSSINSPG